MRTVPKERSLMLDSELRRRVEAQGPHRKEIGAVRPVKSPLSFFSNAVPFFTCSKKRDRCKRSRPSVLREIGQSGILSESA